MFKHFLIILAIIVVSADCVGAKTINDNLHVYGSIGVTSTVDGRDISIDGAALDSHTTDTTDPHGSTQTVSVKIITPKIEHTGSTLTVDVIDAADTTVAITNSGVGAVNLTVDGDVTSASGTLATTDQAVMGANLNVKIVDIGDWDMDADTSTTVSHGLSVAKIRSVSGCIIDDSGVFYYPLTPSLTTSAIEVNAWIDFWVGSLISLKRKTGGQFDTTNFNATSYNRGWLTIIYTD